jgi:predicted ATPase
MVGDLAEYHDTVVEKVEWLQEPRLQGKESRQGRVRATAKQPNNQTDNAYMSNEGLNLSLSFYRIYNHYTRTYKHTGEVES